MAARATKKRMHAFAFMSDRYSSANGSTVSPRKTCMHATKIMSDRYSADGATVVSDGTRVVTARLIESALAELRCEQSIHASTTRAK